MRETICTVAGLIGSAIATAFGGWDTALATLLAFMAIDYVTGLITAGVFHQSPKTTNGKLESNACFKGLIRKGCVLILVYIGCRFDILLGIHYVRDAVCIAFIVSETISIMENVCLMGVEPPEVLRKALEMLQKDGDK